MRGWDVGEIKPGSSTMADFGISGVEHSGAATRLSLSHTRKHARTHEIIVCFNVLTGAATTWGPTQPPVQWVPGDLFLAIPFETSHINE